MTEVAVVADDLSGAVEAAAMFLLRTTRIGVTLATRSVSHDSALDVQVWDTDSRELVAPVAADRAAAAFAEVAGVPLVLKKIDSLMRGNVLAELLAARSLRPNIVVAPALPAAGRIVRGGRIYWDGRLLSDTDAWRAEPAAAHATIAQALAPLPAATLDLGQVRDAGLANTLRATLASGCVPVCDAETDADLDRVVAAAAGLDQPLLVGSAGLAAAMARTMPRLDHSAPTPVAARAGGVLVVVGSAAPSIPGQLAALHESSPDIVRVQPAELLEENARNELIRRIGSLRADVVVVAVDPSARVEPHQARNIAQALAIAVAGAARQAAALVLTGGETARIVLDRLAITDLQPLFQVHHGAVVCAGPGGQLIATRPGSFGAPDSLIAIVRALQNARATPTKESA